MAVVMRKLGRGRRHRGLTRRMLTRMPAKLVDYHEDWSRVRSPGRLRQLRPEHGQGKPRAFVAPNK